VFGNLPIKSAACFIKHFALRKSTSVAWNVKSLGRRLQQVNLLSALDYENVFEDRLQISGNFFTGIARRILLQKDRISNPNSSWKVTRPQTLQPPKMKSEEFYYDIVDSIRFLTVCAILPIGSSFCMGFCCLCCYNNRFHRFISLTSSFLSGFIPVRLFRNSKHLIHFYFRVRKNPLLSQL
jgi:hypothetical protein